VSVLNKVYRKDDNLVARKISNEYIMVPIRQNIAATGYIYTLNAVGGRILELIDGERSVADIAATIVQEYEVTTEQALADTLDFLGQLEALQVLRIVPLSDKEKASCELP
jgi:hypothetical protein